MRPRVLWKFANVLMISRLRSVRQSVLTRTISGRPLLILIIGFAVFIAALSIGFAASILFSTPDSLVSIQQVAVSVAAAIPFFMVTFYFLTGLLWEVNASMEAESTDAINWLPISASEYVTASALSTTYTYSPFLFGALGFSFPIVYYAYGPEPYAALIVSALAASMTGSVAVEILRSGLSRASSSFYRLGGKATAITRLVAVSLVILLTQILFSGFLFFRVLSIAGSGGNEFVPIFWLSTSVTALMAKDAVGFALFLGLGLCFLTVLMFVALFLRGRYWVIAPSSPRLSGYGSINTPGRFGLFKMNPTSAALLRYEFRSATRRRETTRLIVLPILIPLAMVLPLVLATSSPFSPQTGSPPPASLGFAFYAPLLLFGIGLGTVVLGMSSVGREGGRIWNVCALPVTADDLARTKILFTLLVALVGLFVGAIVASFLSGLSIELISYLVAGSGVLLAESGLGLAIGTRYADFAEGPRPRFVTVSGAIIGSIVGMIVMGLVLSPLFVTFILEFIFGLRLHPLAAPLSSALLGALIGWAGYRISIHPLSEMLSELPA